MFRIAGFILVVGFYLVFGEAISDWAWSLNEGILRFIHDVFTYDR